MKIINDKGRKFLEDYFQNKFKININIDRVCTLSFPKNSFNQLIKNDFFSNKMNYRFENGKVKLSYKDYEKILDDSMFDESEEIYQSELLKGYLKDLDHSFLSNIYIYADIKGTLYPEQIDSMKDQIKQIQEKIVPELEKRFKGELLPYAPYGDWDRKMYERYLKLKESNVQTV